MMHALLLAGLASVPLGASDALPWRLDPATAAGTHFYTQDTAAFRALEARRTLFPTGLALPGGPTVDLELERLDFHAERFRVLVNDTEQGLADAHGMTLWTGKVAGDNSSDVYLGLSPIGSYGWIHTAGGVWHIASFKAPGGTWAEPMVRIYSEAVESVARDFARPPGQEFCLANQVQQFGPIPTPPSGNEGDGACARRECTIAVETDYQYYSIWGNLPAAQVYTYCLLTSISNRYEGQAGIVLTFPYIKFHTISAAADGWSTPDISGSTLTMLYEFQNRWTSNPPCFPFGQFAPQGGTIPTGARLAHFISGANLGGGIAYLDVVCPQTTCYGFGVSANMGGTVSYTFPGPPNGAGALNWDFVVVAHELGHNFGACHTHQTCNAGAPIDRCYVDTIDGGTHPGTCSTPPQSCSATGTIMSYCHLCPGGISNITTFFHPFHVTVMQNAASCLPCFTDVGTTICLGIPNSTTRGAILEGSGSTSIAANNLDLTCSQLPTAGGGTTAMIVNSRGPVGLIVHPAAGGVASDGYLCIGASGPGGATFGRHINQIYTGAAGTFTRSIDLQAIPHPPAPPYSVAAQAGQTWYFQVWYRDTGAPGRSNFSSGISVLFTP